MCLSHIRTNIAPGPNGLKGNVWKLCGHQLKGDLTQHFPLLLNVYTAPHTWKVLTVIPIPKIMGAILQEYFNQQWCYQLVKFWTHFSLHIDHVGEQQNSYDNWFYWQTLCKIKHPICRIVLLILLLLLIPCRYMCFYHVFINLSVNPSLIYWIKDSLLDKKNRVFMNSIFSTDFQLRAVYCHHFYFQYIPVSNRLPYGNIQINK